MAEVLGAESLAGTIVHCQAAQPPPACPSFPACPACPSCPACPVPGCPVCPICPVCPVSPGFAACPAAASTSPSVGLAALWAAFLVFLAPSFFTDQGRAFWVALWDFLCDRLPPWWAVVSGWIPVPGWVSTWVLAPFLAVCRFTGRLCCCLCPCGCGRRADNHDNDNGPDNGPDRDPDRDLKQGSVIAESTRASSIKTAHDPPPSHPASGSSFDPNFLAQTRAAVSSSVALADSASTSVSARGPKTTALPARGRRPPRGKAQPLGVNLGQAFHRPGKAPAQGKGKDKDKATGTVGLAALEELMLQ
ncbi:hypothetical protein B0J13DRAFT_556171 [Dactylonectria estremocensis]|uniref:Uncharacterized protein n=1 Tax=Dactylonectria estremocensis TaxID=1079267 RepID=A0A9P9ERP5_9HYPO|nr:hypothetical protein B0J13DRAFT_556171 [Dactylonectria estremocensis]